MDSIQFFYHIVKNNNTLISNLPSDILPEVDECLAESKLLICKVRNTKKRQKKLPIKGGYVYLCTYNPTVTKNDFKKYFDILLSLSTSSDIENSFISSSDNVNRIRHNVYAQLSHIQDELKSISAFEDIPSKNWSDIVDYSQEIILSNLERTAIAILRTIQRTSIALAEFDAYEILSSSRPPQLEGHQIHKVIKLSLQPYLLDFWNKKIKLSFGESYNKVRIDYELINLALGHFWNNATKYVMEDSEISISFSPSHRKTNVTIRMKSLAIKPEEINEIFKFGISGEYAKKTKLDGTGIGMYYIKECMSKSQCEFTITPGTKYTEQSGKTYAINTFKFSFPDYNK